MFPLSSKGKQLHLSSSVGYERILEAMFTPSVTGKTYVV
jgi:hypothetical protein